MSVRPPIIYREQPFSFSQSRYFRKQIAKKSCIKQLAQVVFSRKTASAILPAIAPAFACSFAFKAVQHCNAAIAFIPILTGFFPLSLLLMMEEKNKRGFYEGISCFSKNVTCEAPVTAFAMVIAKVAHHVIDQYMQTTTTHKKCGKVTKMGFSLLSGTIAEIANSFFRTPSPHIAPLWFSEGTVGSAFLPAGYASHFVVASLAHFLFTQLMSQ